jgi:vitamin B12 transporter
MLLMKRTGLLLLWLLPHLALSQTDTTAARLREVQIFGQKVQEYAAGSRVVTIDTFFLQLHNSANLGDILQARTPLYLKNYGPGQLASVSFRGTAARHTALLWHGLNINLPTLGQTDFSLIPVTANSQIALQHGGASANYGTAAIGGAILLSSSPLHGQQFRASVQQDVGAYGHAFTNVGATYSHGKMAGATGLYRSQAENDFPFRNVTRFGTPLEQQQNAAFRQYGFTQDLHYRLNDRTQLSVRGWYTDNDAQVQPSMGSAHANARRANQSLRLMTELDTDTRTGNLSVKTAWFKDRMQYRTDNIASDTDVDTYQTQVEYTVAVQEKLRLKAGAEGQHFRAEVDGYGRPVQENRASGFMLLRYDPLPVLDISLNVRQGLVQGYNPPLTPTLGLNLRLHDTRSSTLTAKGNLARSYRVPTLNERFWTTGNPNLLPENGRQIEAGLVHDYRSTRTRLNSEVNMYRMWVDNWVVWEPGGLSGGWSPRNLQQVQVKGVEFSSDLQYHLGQLRLGVGARYSYTRSEQRKNYGGSDDGTLGRQLVYVPLHNASLFSDLSKGPWQFSANLTFSGYRYTRANNLDWLPPFGLVQVMGGREFRIKASRLQVVGKVHNLTNTVYQTMQYYAMPPRNYSLSFRYFFSKSFL